MEKVDKKIAENLQADSSLIEIWYNFINTTGFHGVNKMSFEGTSSRNTFRSFCWFALWFTCAVYLTYTVLIELKYFYSYPTMSNTYVKFEDKLLFPAITICNLSPLKRSSFDNDEKTKNFHMRTSSLSSFSREINWSDPFYDNHNFFTERTLEDIYKESKNLTVFLKSALFDNKPQNIFHPVITDIGLCMRANTNGELKTSLHGALSNLHLYVDAQTDEDYFSSSMSSGIKIAIHDQLTEPLMSNEGIVIQPGSEVIIEIQRKEHKFLPYPYIAFGNKTCIEDKKYSKSRCLKDCWNDRIHDLCNCTNILAGGSGPFCSNHKIQTCTNPTYANLTTSDNAFCNCPIRCESTIFDYVLSTGSYPSEFIASQLKDMFQMDVSFIRSNLLDVKIYFKDLSTIVTEQVLIYPNAGTIFANLGGQLGLFLGASILTVTELLEFLLFLGWTIALKFKNVGKVTRNTQRTMVK